jgi:hypothetical protein
MDPNHEHHSRILHAVNATGVNFGDVPSWLAAIGTIAAFGALALGMDVERRRRRRDATARTALEHQSQAILLSATVGPVDRERQKRSAIDCLNASVEPVYNVVLGLVFVQGSGPRTTELAIKLCIANNWPIPVATLNVLAPGRFRAWVRETGWGRQMSGWPGVEIAFTDRSGVHWVRRTNGELNQLSTSPISLIEDWGMHAPHHFQTPELLA